MMRRYEQLTGFERLWDKYLDGGRYMRKYDQQQRQEMKKLILENKKTQPTRAGLVGYVYSRVTLSGGGGSLGSGLSNS